MARAEKLRVLPLVLGLSPLLALTPVALATPAQAAPEQQAALQAAPVQNAPVQGDKQDAPLPALRVSSGSLDILHGGTVHVEGTGLSPEFLAHHELRSLTIAPKGSSTYANPYQRSITAALSLTPRNRLLTAVSAPT